MNMKKILYQWVGGAMSLGLLCLSSCTVEPVDAGSDLSATQLTAESSCDVLVDFNGLAAGTVVSDVSPSRFIVLVCTLSRTVGSHQRNPPPLGVHSGGALVPGERHA